MRRTLLLFAAVILLGSLAYFASLDPTETEVADERAFGYPELEDIERIYIADREGNVADLRRGGPTGWTYGAYPANENVMKNLLQAVAQLEVRSLPASTAVPNLVRNLAGGGILVRVYDGEGNKLRGYYIGGGTSGELGAAAIMEGSDNPYVVHLPMWSGNVRHRFNLRGDEWRSKVLFDVDPQAVEYLSIDYPLQQSKAFRMERTRENQFRVTPLVASVGGVKEIPFGVAEGILSRYEDYYVSRYQNEDTVGMLTARERLPFAIVRIKEAGKPEQVASIYPQYRFPGSPQQQLQAYTAFVNDDQDWALLATETTQPLLVGYDSF
ncbi:hypothetical protein CLV84_3624 [Neolewinella xylanilytica]|uniref:DUF4340 domain-containing protein n=1 Tax=Neolewinella xylanilytica TaxID=1514080 RepID=A0A2S6I687_9BACT|nr:hypothetical protein [Neolewinella xylanilytica]PPK86688.1 hypothetical protein CLV84_3624 [Neolewinella xylanilytica]